MPLAIIPGSGLPVFACMIEHRRHRAERRRDRGVGRHDGELHVGRREGGGGVEAEPPEQQDEVPSMAIGRWWPGIVLAEPSLLNLPMRGPSTMAPASAATPPTVWTTPEPAKST